MKDEIEDIGNAESIINPDMWAFLAINKAIEALSSGDNLKGSFLKFTALVNVAESIARGQGILDGDYDEKIKQFKDGDKYKSLNSIEAKNLSLCNKQLELISKSIGSNKNINEPMKLEKA